MKRLPVFVAALSLSFLIYVLYTKSQRFEENTNEITDDITEPESRYIPDAIEKLIIVTTPEEVPAGESAYIG